jgi:hypothetical protein
MHKELTFDNKAHLHIYRYKLIVVYDSHASIYQHDLMLTHVDLYKFLYISANLRAAYAHWLADDIMDFYSDLISSGDLLPPMIPKQAL